ncbi:MAG TPA: polysaccharide biosynthesis tyrosine autokinase [Myxococcaceae bacterium]|nr:polysaccharide biosynthesis tyrosine autokinase [Myxococcaceae bacterium]
MDSGSQAPEFEEEQSSLDWQWYLRALLRRKWWIAGIAAVVLALTAVVTLRQTPIYAASASLVIDVAAPSYLGEKVQNASGDEYGNYWLNRDFMGTQYRIIQSRAVAQRVVDALGLQNDPDFLGVGSKGDEKSRLQRMSELDAVSLLQQRLSVVPQKDTRIVQVRVEDPDPERAALLANEVADAYIAESLALKLRTSESASAWLEERLTDLETKSKQSELALFEFKKDGDILTTALDDRLSIVTERLTKYNAALTEVRTRIAALKARAEAFGKLRRDAPNASDWAEGLPYAEGDTLLTSLRQTLMDVSAQCAELSARYLSDHPALMGCVAKQKASQENLERELNNRIRAAQTELAEAQANERNLDALLEQVKAEAFEVNRKQIAYDQLQREATNDQRLYDLVLTRLKDIELSGMLRTTNVRSLDAARPSWIPVSPNVKQNLLFGLIAGLVLGVGVVLGREFLDSTVKTQEDVEERLRVPFLGLFPMVGEAEGMAAARDLHVFKHPNSAAAECCRAIRTNLLFATPDDPFKTLVVTSSGPEEGKSTITISLGVAMAQSGSRVLLVDTDMRRPRLHKAFGVPNDVGVSSLIVGEGSLERAVKSTEVPGLFVLPCGPIPPNPAELLHAQGFEKLLAELSETYDRIIFDSPPVNAVADAVVLGAQVDGVVLVLKALQTQRELARRGLRALQDVNANVLGAVLNHVDIESNTYGGYAMSYLRNNYAYGDRPQAPAA